MKTISTSLLTLTLLAAAGPNHACSVARDDWMGSDKAAHFGASFAFGVAGSRLTREPWEAVGLALIPGVAKELYDAGQDCNRFSWRDMGWNVAGAVLGVGGGYWMFGPSGVSWHTPF